MEMKSMNASACNASVAGTPSVGEAMACPDEVELVSLTGDEGVIDLKPAKFGMLRVMTRIVSADELIIKSLRFYSR